jgi:hypothetical protein
MYIIERNTGRIEVWIGKSETQYGKYEISGLLKTIGVLLIVGVSLWIGSFL